VNELAIEWFEQKFNKTMADLEHNMAQYRLSDGLMSMYSLIWGDFCGWYLEMIKPAYQQPIDRTTYEKSLDIFEKLMTALHPFMPFVTEEIWHQLKEVE